METNRECVCCKEMPKILEKMSKLEVPVNCITEHPGFDGVCLNVSGYFKQRTLNIANTMTLLLHQLHCMSM